MAYIPDEAIDNNVEISATAFRLYALICRRRNHKTQTAWLTEDFIEKTLGISRSTLFEAKKELMRKNWLRIEQQYWQPTYGNFAPVNKRF